MEKIIEKIKNFYHSKRRMPSYSEIMGIAGYKSKNSVHKLVKKMRNLKIVTQDATGRLLPANMGTVRLLGTVEAGFPSPAEEELVDTMTLDDYLIKNREATYMLEVRGDSMINAGIMPGDVVLAERGADAHHGDIVIAEIDHGWTMKYFHKKGREVHLVPGNPKYKTIVPKTELRIAAVVKAVIRKYA